MKISNRIAKFVVLMTVLALQFVFVPVQSVYAATAPSLGVADSYAIWGKAGVTNDVAGTTHIWGNVGADLLTSITNLLASQVDGAIIAPTDASVQTAISDAYTFLSTPPQEAPTVISLAGIVTVTPGVYTVSATETLNDTVTLDGAGVYIFRSDSAFTVGSDATVLLTNGATACNVFWQIPSTMIIGSGAEMVGTIITNTEAITFGTGATLQGRAFSSIAAVTLLSNQITRPSCAEVTASTPAPTPAPLVCTGTQHANANNTQCVDFEMPGPGQPSNGGTTSTGQVLGASTLASTGDGNSIIAIMMMVLGLSLSTTALYAFKKTF